MLYMYDSISLLAEQAIYSQEGGAHGEALRIQKAARSVIDKYKQKDIDDARAESLLIGLLSLSMRSNDLLRKYVYKIEDFDESSRIIIMFLRDELKSDIDLTHFVKRGVNPLIDIDDIVWPQHVERYGETQARLRKLIERRRAASAAKAAWDSAIDYLKRPWEDIDACDFLDIALARGASGHDIINLQQIFVSVVQNSPIHQQHEAPWMMGGVPYDARYEGQDIWDSLRRATEAQDCEEVESCMEALCFNSNHRNTHPYYIKGWRSLQQAAIDYVKAKMTGGKWKKLLNRMTDKGLMYVRND